MKNLSFENFEVLNRSQLKSILGGAGSCAWRSGSTGIVYTGYSSQEAYAGAVQTGGNWCCSSCCGSSWAGGYGCQ